ncbi:outer membrane protein assembly factor BamD [Candidatus Pelagibacter sp.]|nr:outer membrane protein assembly factor BamD [Candidatus Pelagibacter sp.]
MKKILSILLILFVLVACSQAPKKIITEVEGDSIEQQMIIAYEEGIKALEAGDIFFATKKFNEAELLFPQSEWAPKASLMSAYTYWSDAYYRQSIEELKRFLKVYPNNNNLDYAYYLLAMNYYDSIVDEKKDLRPLQESKKYFEILIKEFPNTDYALDAKYKLKLIEDILAAKEIYLARHYMKKKKWIAALNRLKVIIDKHQETVFIEEALHRVVEIYYVIGLDEEAKKYASILGYNYNSSEWYKMSYKILNKDYQIIDKTNRDKKKLLDRIKSFM